MADLVGAGYYDGPTQETNTAYPPTLKQRLDLAVKQAEEKLADVKRARELFEKNPDLEELLNIMQRGRF